MNQGRTIFSQLMDFIPAYQFNQCIARYRGNHRMRRFSCRDQLLCMAFAQLTYRESLRDLEICLRSVSDRLYHIGIRGKVSRSTLADANERRDWRIYADLAARLILRARQLYSGENHGLDFNQPLYAFDSTTIDLCLSLFPWAQFRRRKSVIKLHTLMDLRGNIPCFIYISTGRMVDRSSLDFLPIEPGAFYVMDRGYIDFARLFRFTKSMAFFVTRANKNLDFDYREHRLIDKTTGLRSDTNIRLRGPKSRNLYPKLLRRVVYRDNESGKKFVFLTNNFSLPAIKIAELYQHRWQVELFFKWIKQHLRIKSFYGLSPNAVHTQIWIAVSVYVLIAIIRKELKIDKTMAEVLQVLSVTLFEKTPILQLFNQNNPKLEDTGAYKQLKLFDF